jgi:hypothetical protein
MNGWMSERSKDQHHKKERKIKEGEESLNEWMDEEAKVHETMKKFLWQWPKKLLC